jgi:parvulin-like peptidyl-prolyl isomerase
MYELRTAGLGAQAIAEAGHDRCRRRMCWKRQMLERLIMDRAQLQYARESGMRVDDAQLDQAIGRIAANNKLTPAAVPRGAGKGWRAVRRFREEIRNEMTTVRLREREVDSKLVISDGESTTTWPIRQPPAAARNTSWRTSCCGRRNRPVRSSCRSCASAASRR